MGSVVSSALMHGILTPTANLYTGPAALRAVETSQTSQTSQTSLPARISGSGMPMPIHSTSKKASVLGPAIGASIGGLILIALTLALILLHRRRKHRKFTIFTEKPSPHDTPSTHYPSGPAELESPPSQFSTWGSSQFSNTTYNQTIHDGYQYTSVLEAHNEGDGAIELPGSPIVPQELDAETVGGTERASQGRT